MTTFAELQADVITETKRPDKTSLITLEIQKATLKFHMADFWLNDLVKGAVVPLTPLYSGQGRYQIDTTASPFTRFRKAQLIREYVAPPTGLERNYSRIEANDIIDSYNVEKVDYWYQAGSSIYLNSLTEISNASVNYYRVPVITADVNYSSWIADLFKYAIIMEAAAGVFKAIGKDDEFQRMRAEFSENLALLRTMVTSSGE